VVTGCDKSTHKISDQNFFKVDLQYFHDYVGLNLSIGLAPNLIIEVSGALGSDEISVSGEMAFDTAS